MKEIFYRTLLNDKIKIEPKYLSSDYRTSILYNKLKSSVEGVCSRHGYIKENSVEIYKVSPGVVDLIGLNGYIVFDVYYYADVCNPLVGNIIKAKVINVNKFGILAEIEPILEIVIAKNSVNILSDSNIDLEIIAPGDYINVEIIGKKFELNDKKISIIGRVVSNLSDKKGGGTSSQFIKNQIPLEDEEENEEPIQEEEQDENDEDNEEENEEDDEVSSNGSNAVSKGKESGNFFDSENEFSDNYEFYGGDTDEENSSGEESD